MIKIGIEMAKIYYSGSILGTAEEDAELPVKIVEYLMEQGHDVLSKHVAFPSNHTGSNGNKMKLPRAILDTPEMPSGEDLYKAIRKFDTECVDKAEFFVALINAPAHGVGMEIERALLRGERGIPPPSQILCLAHRKNREKISGMIRGVDRGAHPNFDIFIYETFEDIKTRLKSLIGQG